jgi:hypothetical protein
VTSSLAEFGVAYAFLFKMKSCAPHYTWGTIHCIFAKKIIEVGKYILQICVWRYGRSWISNRRDTSDSLSCKFPTAMKACHLICSRPVVVACVFDDELRGCAATLWTDGLTQLIWLQLVSLAQVEIGITQDSLKHEGKRAMNCSCSSPMFTYNVTGRVDGYIVLRFAFPKF